MSPLPLSSNSALAVTVKREVNKSAVTNIIHGRPVLNKDALVNPESLDYYEKIREGVFKS